MTNDAADPDDMAALVLTVSCPTCPAKQGQPCRTRRLARGYHLSRADRAVRRQLRQRD
jgi:hypothetical protein